MCKRVGEESMMCIYDLPEYAVVEDAGWDERVTGVELIHYEDEATDTPPDHQTSDSTW